MSLWRRAPRQVYRVFGEEEYLTEEHVAADSEFLREAEDSRSYENGSEIRATAYHARSRTPRLVGVGLLLGVTVGVAGLVISQLSHESSPPRASSSGPSFPRRALLTSSGSVSQHASGEVSVDSEAHRSNRRWTGRVSASVYGRPGLVARRRMSGSVAPANESHPSRKSAPAWTSGSLWRSSEAASASYETLVSFAASGGEFEFER